MRTGARRMPSYHGFLPSSAEAVTCQKRVTDNGSSSSRKAQPWLNPALGARIAWDRMRSTASGASGSSV